MTAGFELRANSKCFEDTRVEVVQKIDDWTYGPRGRPFYWLNSPVGFGKSAIARTVAHRWASAIGLAAGFFFFRNSGN